MLPAELRIAVLGARHHEQARERLGRRIGDAFRAPAELLEVREVLVVQRGRLDRLELGDARCRTGELDPSRVLARRNAVELIERVLAVLLGPQRAAPWIEVHAEAVADPVTEYRLQVLTDFATHRRAD